MDSESKSLPRPATEKPAPDEATRFRNDLMLTVREAMQRAGAIDKSDPGMREAWRELQNRRTR